MMVITPQGQSTLKGKISKKILICLWWETHFMDILLIIIIIILVFCRLKVIKINYFRKVRWFNKINKKLKGLHLIHIFLHIKHSLTLEHLLTIQAITILGIETMHILDQDILWKTNLWTISKLHRCLQNQLIQFISILTQYLSVYKNELN